MALRRTLALAAAAVSGLSLVGGTLFAAPAAAQYAPPPSYAAGYYPQTYTVWLPAWDRGRFDRRHVLLGTVASFKPYRLALQHPDGFVQPIDLKPGTVILPTGGTPLPNQHVAVIGYFSNGTFIANRLILRNY